MTRNNKTAPKRPFRVARIGALLALLTVVIGWVWAHEGHEALPTRGVSVDTAKGTLTLGPEARKALGVEVAEVTAGELPDELVAPAAIVAPWQRHAFVSTRLGGKVAALHVRPGEAVRQGQLVAEVESLELADLQRELLDAQNESQLSRKNLEALEELNRSGGVPDLSVTQAWTLHQQNRNSLSIARRKLSILGVSEGAVNRLLRDRRRTIRTLPIFSPIAGTALHVDVGVGQVVEPLEHLLEVVDLRRVWVQVRILEKDLHRVRVGQRLVVRLAGAKAPKGDWSGTVQVKERYLDPQTHWGTAWAELANPQGRLLPGLFGQARVRLATRGPGLLLPASALVSAGAERFVFVEEGPGQYRRRNVVVQKQDRDAVQVAPDTGMYPGDRVVTAGSHELASYFVQGVLRLSPEAERNIGLRVEPARRRSVAEVIALSGVVDLPPQARAVVSARLGGTLDRILVDRDQAVRAGDVVAEVASLEITTLQLDLLRSHLQARLLEQTLRRLRSTRGATPERLIRENQTAFVTARQRRDSLRTKLRVAGLSAGQIQSVQEGKSFALALPVRAPADGVVVRFRATLGQAVKAESPLFEVHDLSAANLCLYVPERSLPLVKVGQRGRVRLTAEPGFVGEAVLARRGRAVGTGHRTLPVWADLKPAPGTSLLPGMLARLTLVDHEPAPTLAVPLEAIWREGLLAYVFVRGKDGVFERRLVSTGRRDDRFVEITRGLSAGENVAVRGVAELQTAHASIQ
jgi:RND family efflux transporter MFP subunit